MLKSLVGFALLLSSNAFAWTKIIDKDQISDKKTAVLHAISKKAVWNGKKAQLDIMLDCAQPLNVKLTHPWVIGDGPVQIRIDRNPAQSVYARITSNHKSLLIGDQSASQPGDPQYDPSFGINLRPSDVADQMAKGKNLLIRYKDAAESSFDAEFSTAGFKALYDKTCLKKLEAAN